MVEHFPQILASEEKFTTLWGARPVPKDFFHQDTVKNQNKRYDMCSNHKEQS